ncbi:MAG TPA: glycoside-pentoside-hexuronide (GPH):cation symporter [Candidatus Blautia stercoravium]|nr:glycoside-pentoside-hexuronide (GPH):cation symporter [Candidatus Blautia stercoravium]
MKKQTNAIERPFGMRDKVGYLFGDLGNDLMFNFASSYILVFYTKVMGINAALVGAMLLFSKLLDAFTDVTMGRIVDTCKPAKDGRFRPWIRRMAGPVALANFLMYQSGLAGAPMTIKIILMWVTYILWGSVFYTSINIPYGSMAAALTEEPKGRASLSTWRSLGGTFSSLFIGVVVPLIIYSTDANGNQIVVGSKITLIAGVFSVAALICYAICYMNTTERVKVLPNINKVSLAQTFKGIFMNKALIVLILCSILLMLNSNVTNGLSQYVYIDCFNSKTALSLMSMIGIGLSLLMAPFIASITDKFGKKEASAVLFLFASATQFILFFLRVTNVWVYLAFAMINSFAYGFWTMTVWAHVSDVIDYQQIITHSREDGTVYASYSFSRKIGQALGSGLSGLVLEMIAFDTTTGAVQTAEVKASLYSLATCIPAVVYVLVALGLIFLYPLTKKVINENVVELKRRREQGIQ